MIKLQKHHILFGVVALMSFCGVLLSNPASAMRMISLSPVSEHISLNPGSKHSGHFTIANTGDEEYDYHIGISPYQVSDYDYTPISGANNAYTQIVDWITLSSTEGHLAVGETKDIFYVISVPKDTPAGGQYAMISAAFESGKEGNIGISGAVATVIYAQVAGDTRLSGSILDSKITGFTLKNIISTTTTVENTGNVDTDAEVIIDIKSALSGSTIYTNKENPAEMTVLPGTIRNLDVSWDDAPSIGAFKVELKVAYLNETRNLSKTVIICPVWFILLIIILILVLVIRIIGSSRRLNRRRGRSSKFSL